MQGDERDSAPMTDDELLAATAAARGLAHRAPFAEYSTDHLGHTRIVNHTNSWAKRSDEFMALARRCRERGLVPPPCDCHPDAHIDPRLKKIVV